MKWIVVRTYGNGQHMNKIFPLLFQYLSQAEEFATTLNDEDCGASEKWVAMPINQYNGPTYNKQGKQVSTLE